MYSFLCNVAKLVSIILNVTKIFSFNIITGLLRLSSWFWAFEVVPSCNLHEINLRKLKTDHVFYNVQFSETFSHAKVEAENGQPSLRVAATTSFISLPSSSSSSSHHHHHHHHHQLFIYHHWKPQAVTTPAISIWLFHRIICSFFPRSYILSFVLFLVDCLLPVNERVLGSRPSIAAHPQTVPVRSPVLCQALDHLSFYSYQFMDISIYAIFLC